MLQALLRAVPAYLTYRLAPKKRLITLLVGLAQDLERCEAASKSFKKEHTVKALEQWLDALRSLTIRLVLAKDYLKLANPDLLYSLDAYHSEEIEALRRITADEAVPVNGRSLGAKPGGVSSDIRLRNALGHASSAGTRGRTGIEKRIVDSITGILSDSHLIARHIEAGRARHAETIAAKLGHLETRHERARKAIRRYIMETFGPEDVFGVTNDVLKMDKLIAQVRQDLRY